MSEPHRMTLRPPWEAETLPDGRTRYRRRFGRPRTLDATETVWLVGEGVPAGAEVMLNGGLLGVADGGFRFDVTAKLNPRNELTIDGAGELVGVVGVEVRSAGETRQ